MDLPGVSPPVFHLRNRTVILVLSPLVFALSIARILDGLRSGEPWLNWLAALTVWLFLLILGLRRRLRLTQDGIEYRDSFTTDHVPWAQVARLVSRRTLGIWTVEGLEVRARSPRPRDHFIDLTQFSKSWRQDSIGAILREKAPHLFQQPAPPPDSA